MIAVEQLFTNPTTGEMKPHSSTQERTADDLLTRVNALVDEAVASGKFKRRVDKDTGTEISGSRGGSGAGGFRLKGEGPTSHTSHAILFRQTAQGWVEDEESGAAVDCFDPDNDLDRWLDEFEDGLGGNSKLEEYGLYREHGDDTPGWCHLTSRSPWSGHRTFKP